MARSISWLSILDGLHHWACHSKKAQVTSVDIQRKFQIQPRSAQQLMEMMPREEFGGTTFIRMEDLRDWLKRVVDARAKGGDKAVRELLTRIRTKEKPVIVNRRIVEIEKDEAAALRNAHAVMEAVEKPAGMKLRRGRIEFAWGTMEQLVQALYWLASEMQDEAYFESRYCPGNPTQPLPSAPSSPAAPPAQPRPEQTS